MCDNLLCCIKHFNSFVEFAGQDIVGMETITGSKQSSTKNSLDIENIPRLSIGSTKTTDKVDRTTVLYETDPDYFTTAGVSKQTLFTKSTPATHQVSTGSTKSKHVLPTASIETHKITDENNLISVKARKVIPCKYCDKKSILKNTSDVF